MKKIIIVGAGGFGQELLQWIKDINKVEKKWEILGFIDDNLNALANSKCDYKVVGTIKDWQPKEDEVFALAMGSPALKRKIVALMKEKGAKFESIIHPTAMLSEFAEHGEGLIMFPGSKLSCNSTVGEHVTILSTLVGHDTLIGDYTVISGGCNIVRNVKIGNDVFLAAGVCIAQDITIGDGAYLGLGSVILKDVAPGATMFGNPARPMPTMR